MENQALEKTKSVIKEIEVKTFELFEKMESDVMDYEASGLSYEIQKRVEEIYQGLFNVYNLADDFLNEKEKTNENQ